VGAKEENHLPIRRRDSVFWITPGAAIRVEEPHFEGGFLVGVRRRGQDFRHHHGPKLCIHIEQHQNRRPEFLLSDFQRCPIGFELPPDCRKFCGRVFRLPHNRDCIPNVNLSLPRATLLVRISPYVFSPCPDEIHALRECSWGSHRSQWRPAERSLVAAKAPPHIPASRAISER
jgi:hypothetical protein